jgi:hypothetical protein
MDFLGKSITGLTKVSMNMTKHLLSSKNFQEENVVFSPLSLYTVLSMVANGSEGPTQHQLLSFLESKSTDQLKSLSSHTILTFSSTFLQTTYNFRFQSFFCLSWFREQGILYNRVFLILNSYVMHAFISIFVWFTKQSTRI